MKAADYKLRPRTILLEPGPPMPCSLNIDSGVTGSAKNTSAISHVNGLMNDDKGCGTFHRYDGWVNEHSS